MMSERTQTESWKVRHKLLLQTIALALTMFAAVPVYIGLQGMGNGLAWVGLFVAAVGMALGLWAS